MCPDAVTVVDYDVTIEVTVMNYAPSLPQPRRCLDLECREEASRMLYASLHEPRGVGVALRVRDHVLSQPRSVLADRNASLIDCTDEPSN